MNVCVLHSSSSFDVMRIARDRLHKFFFIKKFLSLHKFFLKHKKIFIAPPDRNKIFYSIVNFMIASVFFRMQQPKMLLMFIFLDIKVHFFGYPPQNF
jgi:hypothetical protein